MSAIARRYARAAVEAAVDAGGSAAVDSMLDQLRSFAAAYAEASELREVLLSPVFKQKRSDTLAAVVDELKLSGVARTLILLLAENDRISIIDDLVDDVEGFADDRADRDRAHVTTAVSMTEGQAARVAVALEKRLGRKVVMEMDIDPSIRGGMICHIGDLTIDNSVQRQLDLIRERLTTGA